MQTSACTYPFGLDPKWYVATNELAFFNSLKMKFAVIIGVTHMLFGIVLKGVNATYFKQPIDIIFEFVPQIIFMSILFGYMVIMIFMKWSIAWNIGDPTAPSIITMLMNVFLGMGSLGPDINVGYTATGEKITQPVTPLFGQPYGAQSNLHFWILILSGICVPVMLFPKPILQWMKAKQHNPGFDRFVEEVNKHLTILAPTQRRRRTPRTTSAQGQRPRRVRRNLRPSSDRND